LDLHGGELDITAVSRVQVNGNDIDFTLANDTLSIPIALDGLTTITAFNTSTPD
jgi:hypothetical protein